MIRGIAPEDVAFTMACVGGVDENQQLGVEEELLINAIKKRFTCDKRKAVSALKRAVKIGAIKIEDGVVILIGGD